MTTWIGTVYATTAKYLKDKVDAMKRDNAWLAMAESYGRIKKYTGRQLVWNIIDKLADVTNLDDAMPSPRVRKNVLDQASIDWAHYQVMQVLSEFDILVNQGQEQMAQQTTLAVDTVVESLKNRLAGDIYRDGNAAANIIHGTETWGSTSSVNAVGAGVCNDTYAGISTALGGLGGSAPSSGTWPNGATNTPEYDAWTPLILSATNSYFGSPATWAANCLNLLGLMATWQTARTGTMPNHVFLNPLYFWNLISQLQTKERVMIDATKTSRLAKYGFDKMIAQYMGIEFLPDYRCPAATGYGFHWDSFEINTLKNELFPMVDKDEFFIDKTFNFSVRNYLQVRFVNLRNFVKIAELG